MNKHLSTLLYVGLHFLSTFLSAQEECKINHYAPETKFISITVDPNNTVWAGTETEGLFYYDQANAIDFVNSEIIGINRVVNSLAADNVGYLWVGNGGHPSNHFGGGIHHVNINNYADNKRYSPTTDFDCYPNYIIDGGVGSLNAKCICIDQNNKVWSAQGHHDLKVSSNYFLTPGTLTHKNADDAIFSSPGGFNDYIHGYQVEGLPYPAFTCNPPNSEIPGSRFCSSLAVCKEEVWVGVNDYKRKDNGEYIPVRLVRYDLSGNYLGMHTQTSIGIPSEGVFNGIYLSDAGHNFASISTGGKGFVVQCDNEWTHMSIDKFPSLPHYTSINDNAIWGNEYGAVFIGTNEGLLVYNGLGDVTNPEAYEVYTTAQGLPTNNIQGGYAVESTVWMASDNGVIEFLDFFPESTSSAADLPVLSSQINVFPNPAQKEITIDLSHLDRNEFSDLRMYNISGQLVNIENLQTQIDQLTLNIAALPEGIYFIEIKNKTNQQVGIKKVSVYRP